MRFPFALPHAVRIVVAVVALVALATLALAAGASRRPRWEGQEPLKSCKTEVRTICRGARLGSGEVLMCLLNHADDASPRCRKALVDAAARLEIRRRIYQCRRSMRELCPPPVKAHEILSCLQEQRARLPALCVAQLDAELGRMQRCAPDNPPVLI